MSEKYKMSFTTGGLFYRESVKVAKVYSELSDWAEVKKQTINNNVLQVPSLNSARRLSREIISRLEQLSAAELQLFLTGNHSEQKQLLWLAVCRQYKFIYHFATDVLHDKFLHLNMRLTTDDYNVFFNTQAQWHEELANLSTATQKKLRQVFFKIMREADLISRDSKINPAFLTPRMAHAIKQNNAADFSVFPVHDDQVKELAG